MVLYGPLARLMMTIALSIVIVLIILAILATAVSIALTISVVIVKNIVYVAIVVLIMSMVIVVIMITVIIASIVFVTFITIMWTVMACTAILAMITFLSAIVLNFFELHLSFLSMPLMWSVLHHCLKKQMSFVTSVWRPCVKKLFDIYLATRQSHCATEQAFLKVCHQLYSTVHEIMCQHESRLLDSRKPSGQLVANVWEPVKPATILLFVSIRFELFQAKLHHFYHMSFVPCWPSLLETEQMELWCM